MAEWSLNLEETESGDIDDWEDNCGVILRDSVLGGSKWQYQVDGVKQNPAYAVNSTLDGATYIPRSPLVKKLIIPQLSGALMRLVTFNLTIDGGPVTTNYYARFLQFDLNQAYRAIVNTPVPVR